MTSYSTDARWTQLLQWLNSHGFDSSTLCVEQRLRAGAGSGLFATNTIQPGSHLFTIPSSALLNHKTLQALYPPVAKSTIPPLSEFQIISLHLWLWRPSGDEQSRCTMFGPYIDVLPREFDGHPLTWRIKHDSSVEVERCRALLGALPSPVSFSLSEVASKFYKDWKAVEDYAKSKNLHACIHSDTPTLEFLWAWLNVNTRCVYHRLEDPPSHPDNFTLCPILDLLNHTPFSQSSVQVRAHRAKHMLLTSPNTVLLNAGDELHLKYGQRSNTELFVEYGFVNELVDHGSDFPAEISLDVDIQCVIEPMIRGLGVARAQRMKELLKDEGYEGDWTIHLQPSPAHPSYRVTTCLRLYALFAEHGPDTILDTQAVKLWKDTLAGRRPCISQRNEVAWRTVLRELCTGLIGEAQTASQQTLTTKEGWERWAWRCVRALGAEMGMVARAVGESVDAGEEF